MRLPHLPRRAALDRLPIFIGGTGLYFKALLRGLADVPPVPADVREAVRARLVRDGIEALHAELARRDPVMGERLKPRDRARVARALEVIEATGRSINDWHTHGLPPLLSPANVTAVFLAPERAELYARIDRRFAAMLEEGALEEVAALARRGLDPILPAMKAHGVPALIRHLKGRDDACGGRRHRRHRYPSLRQAPVHLVSSSAAGVRMGQAGGGASAPRIDGLRAKFANSSRRTIKTGLSCASQRRLDLCLLAGISPRNLWEFRAPHA